MPLERPDSNKSGRRRIRIRGVFVSCFVTRKVPRDSTGLSFVLVEVRPRVQVWVTGAVIVKRRLYCHLSSNDVCWAVEFDECFSVDHSDPEVP